MRKIDITSFAMTCSPTLLRLPPCKRAMGLGTYVSACSSGAVPAYRQDIEATMHCIRYIADGVPLGEEVSLPILFGDAVLGQLAGRRSSSRGESRLRLTTVSFIRELVDTDLS